MLQHWRLNYESYRRLWYKTPLSPYKQHSHVKSTVDSEIWRLDCLVLLYILLPIKKILIDGDWCMLWPYYMIIEDPVNRTMTELDTNLHEMHSMATEIHSHICNASHPWNSNEALDSAETFESLMRFIIAGKKSAAKSWAWVSHT